MKDFSVFVHASNKNYTFYLKSDAKLEQKINSLACQIIGKQNLIEKDLANRSVTVWDEQGVIRYKVDQEDYTLDEDHHPLPNTLVKVIRQSELKLPKKLKTIKEIVNDLFRKWSIEKPVARFFAGLIVYPLSLLIRIFCPKREDYQAFFQQMTDSSQPDALLDNLKWSLEIFHFPPIAGVPEEFQLSFQLKEAIHQAEQIRKTRDFEICLPVAEQIIKRWNQAKDLAGERNVFIIPSGSWKQEQFHPCLFSFYKNEEGRLCLSYFHEHQADVSTLDFSFPQELTASALSKILKPLFILSFKPEPKPDNDFYKDLLKGLYAPAQEQLLERHLYSRELRLEDLLEQNDPELMREVPFLNGGHDVKNLPEQKLEEFYHLLFSSIGGASFIRESKRSHLSNDPWKILQETLQMQFPEIPQTEKFLFILSLFLLKAETMVHNYRYFTKTEKEKWMNRLTQELKSLQRSARKIYGDDAILKELVEGNVFDKTKDLIQQLHKRMEQKAELQPEIAELRLKQLDQIVPQALTARIPSLLSSAKKRQTPLGLDAASLMLVQTIQDSIAEIETGQNSREKILKLQQEFGVLATHLNELVEDKKFGHVLNLYHLLQRDLPVPNCRLMTNCWMAIFQSLEECEGTTLQKLARDLTKIGHYFWECKLRLREELTPEEAVYLLNTQAILEFLVLGRKQLVRNKLEQILAPESLQKILEAGLHYNEYYYHYGCLNSVPWSSYESLKKAIDWKKIRSAVSFEEFGLFFCNFHDFNTFRKVVHQEFLRTSFSPHLNQKLIELEQFIIEAPFKWELNEFRDESLELYEFAKLLGAWHLYHELPLSRKEKGSIVHHPEVEKSLRVLAPTVLSLKDIDPKKPHLPPQFSDVLRHYVYMQNLWDIKFNIRPYQSPNPIKGFAKGIKEGIGGAFDSLIHGQTNETLDEKMSYNQAKSVEMFQVISKFQRLDLAAAFYTPLRLPFINDYYQFNPHIVDAKEPRANPFVEITEKLSYYDYKGTYSIQMDPFFEKMGKGSFGRKRLASNDEEKFLLTYLKSDKFPMMKWFLTCLETTLPTFINWDKTVSSDWLKNRLSKKNYIEQTNAFSPYNIIEVFDLILQRPDYLESLDNDAEKRLFTVLFRFNLVQSLVYKHLDYFNYRHRELKNLIDRLLKRPNPKQAFFLLFLCSQLHHHFKYIAKNELSQETIALLDYTSFNPALLEELIEQWPSFDSQTDKTSLYFKKALDYLHSDQSDFRDQVDLCTYLVLDFAMNPDYHHPEKLLQIAPKTLAQIVYLSKKIENGVNSATMPMLAKIALDWTQEHLIPFLPKLETDLLGFIEEYFLLHTQIVSDGIWKREENSQLWQKGQSILDLSTMNFLKIHGQKPKGQNATIPKIITESKEFKELFGQQPIKAAVQVTENPNVLIYTLQGLPFRIRYDLSSQVFYFEQKIRFQGQKNWCRLSKILPLESKPKKLKLIERILPYETKKMMEEFKDQLPEPSISRKGIEHFLEQQGFWLDLGNPERGFFVYSQKTAPTEENIFVLSFKKGVLIAVQTPSGKSLIPSCKDYESVLCPLEGDKIFFARSSHESYISEIRLPSAGIVLQREDKSSMWTYGKEMTWKIGGAGTPLASQFKVFGKNLEQFALIFENTRTKEYRLMLWPHQASFVKNQLNLDKSRTPDHPLKIDFDFEGKIVRGSIEAFLYLVYLYAQCKDYQRALYYLNSCYRAGLLQPGNFQLLKYLSSLFQEMPGYSLRNIAIKLKAELLMRKIDRECPRKFKPADWKEVLGHSQKMAFWFSIYLHQKNRSYSGKERLTEEALAKEVDLSAMEIEELRGIQRESFQEFMRPLAQRQNFWVEKINFSAIENQIHIILMRMQKPRKHVDLALMHPLKVENVIDRFFELWNLIIEKNLQFADLLFLFGPAEKSLKQILNKDKLSWNEILMFTLDLCRKMLLGLASLPQDQRLDLKYNLKKVYSLHQEIPTTPVGLALKTIASFTIENHFIVREKNLLNPIKKLLHRMQEVVQFGVSQQTHEELRQKQAHVLLDEKVFDIDRYKLSLPNELLQGTLDKLPDDKNAPLIPTIEKLESETGVNLVIEQRKTSLEQQILSLEKTLDGNKTASPLVFDTPRVEEVSCFSYANYFLDLPQQSGISPHKIDEVLAQLREGLNLSEQEKEGMQEAAAFLRQEYQHSHLIVDAEKLPDLAETVKSHGRLLQKASEEYKNQIHHLLQSKGLELPQKLRWAIVNQDDIPNDEIISRLLDEYQKIRHKLPEELCKLISLYLLVEAEKTQFEEIIPKSLHHLDKLSQSRAEFEEQNEWLTEWRILSNHLYRQIEAAANRTRYPVLNQFTRKYLVAEYRTKVIMRPQVCQLIEKIVQNPCAWYELRPGLGKTSFVLPLLLLLLPEEGYFPVALIKDELIEQNYEALDPRTKLLSEQSAVRFTFNLNDPHSPLTLIELYYNLLKAKEANSYAITTINQLANIEHALNQYKKKIHELLQEIFLDHQPDYLKISEIQQKFYWLAKIRNLLKSQNIPFKTILFGDEIDEILHILYENNLGISSENQLNGMICEIMEILIQEIFTSVDPKVVKFREALKSGSHAALVDEMDQINPIIVKSLKNSPLLYKALGCFPGRKNTDLLKKMPMETFVDAICKTWPQNPHLPNPFKEFEPSLPLRNGLYALSKLLKTLKMAIAQDFYIDYGLKKDGYTVGPKTSGVEKTGMFYGNEFDIICNQYLHFASGLELDEDFLKQILFKFQETEPLTYKTMLEEALKMGSANLREYLTKPEAWEARIRLMRSQVIQSSLILSNKKQSKLSLQSLVQNSLIGGMTGTLNSYLLPETADFYKASNAQGVVTGETYLRIGVSEPPEVCVLNKDVSVINYFVQCAKDLDCKAIINEGQACLRKKTEDIVQELREHAPNRTYVFIHSEERVPYIWLPQDPGSSGPIKISKQELEELLLHPANRKNILFFFSPADARGTDFMIPFGYGAVFTGLTTTIEKFTQSVWRKRGLGEQHRIRFYIPQATAERISQKEGAAITWIDLVNHIHQYTSKNLKSIHLKAQLEKIKTLLVTGARDILAESPVKIDFSINLEGQQEQLLADMMAEDYLFTALEPLMIYDNETVFEDLQINYEEKIELYMREFYQKEKETIKSYMAKLCRYPNLDHPRIQKAVLRLNKLLADLKKQEDQFFHYLPYHQKYLPEMVCKVNSMPGSFAHVQQQAQQQQQTQQQTTQIEITGQRPDLEEVEAKTFIHWKDLTKTKLPLIGIEAIYFSPNSLSLFKRLSKGRVGHPVFKIFILKDHAGQWIVSLMTHLDFHLILDQIAVKKDNCPSGVYSLMNGAYYEDGVLPIKFYGPEPDLDNSQEVLLKLVQVKCLLGYHQYSEKEEKILKNWIKSLKTEVFYTLLEYIQEHCTTQLRELLHSFR